MTARSADYRPALDAALGHATAWLDAVGDRPIPPRAGTDALAAAFGAKLPDGPGDPVAVVDQLVDAAEPGLLSIASGRFFGWVMGGTLPAALAADWLVSAWDQNAGMRTATPGVVAAEETAARWLLDLLALPATGDVGFTTGATTANFSCLAAAREQVLTAAGWDVGRDGLTDAPRIRVLVGEQRHASVDLALRYLGLGLPARVDVDDQGRIDIAALTASFEAGEPGAAIPTILCLQAGNLHSGAFDDFAAAVEVAHRHGAWVHVDGAFGLWAAASPKLAHLTAGCAEADSWATDAHKTLNVPYDCGLAIVADAQPLRTALGVHTSYLFADDAGDPLDRVPEMSRRARGVPVWAALAQLGRSGVAALVDGLVGCARALADGLSGIDGVEVLNDVVYTQICFTVGDDDRTEAVMSALLGEGVTWMSGSRWASRRVIRVSVSNWSTDDDDVRASLAAVRRAVAGIGS